MHLAVGCRITRWQVFIFSSWDPWKMIAFCAGLRFHKLLPYDHLLSHIITYRITIWIMIPYDSQLTHVDSGFLFGQWYFHVFPPSAGANVAGIWFPCVAPKWDWVCEGPVGCVRDSFIQFLNHGWTWVAEKGVELSSTKFHTYREYPGIIWTSCLYMNMAQHSWTSKPVTTISPIMAQYWLPSYGTVCFDMNQYEFDNLRNKLNERIDR